MGESWLSGRGLPFMTENAFVEQKERQKIFACPSFSINET